LKGLHPSRSHALTHHNPPNEGVATPKSQTSRSGDGRQLSKAEKIAAAEEKRNEAERNQKERERKIKHRERKRRDLRKMTSKGQPVMKTRLEDLLGKVKRVMTE
jgi:hypothetical protein